MLRQDLSCHTLPSLDRSQTWRGATHHGPYGGFHKWGYPNSWMVYNGKSYSNWWFGGTPISGNLHILVPRIPASSWFSLVSVKFYGQIPHLSICKFLKGSRSACFPNPKFLLTFIKLLFQDIGQGLNDQCHYSITVSLLKRSQRRITELKVAGKKTSETKLWHHGICCY